jgi:hypothetical protein
MAVWSASSPNSFTPKTEPSIPIEYEAQWAQNPSGRFGEEKIFLLKVIHPRGVYSITRRANMLSVNITFIY